MITEVVHHWVMTSHQGIDMNMVTKNSNSASQDKPLCIGNVRFVETDIAAVCAREGMFAAWTKVFDKYGATAPSRVEGDFAVAISDTKGRMLLAVDRFSIRTLCYRLCGDQLLFGERADEVAGPRGEVDPQSIFDYLYFHVIPAPRTLFKNVFRLPAGHSALFDKGKLTVAPYWTPSFEESLGQPIGALRVEFRQLLRNAVSHQVDGSRIGCFLSGGTDSSTIAGILGEVTGQPARTFSIGFDAEGYDEMAYARIAAKHFRTEHHEYYVTPDDLVRAIPLVAASFDQPFGNSSAIPAYFCAKMAKSAGVERMLGGDGGDELFGGNTRYAKQRLFSHYQMLPAILRSGLLEPLLRGSGRFGNIPGVRKVASYVEQAKISMPERMQMYNLLTRLGLKEVLTPEFLASVDTGGPMAEINRVYGTAQTTSLVNRMLAYDWKYTLADTDLPKVVGATALVGLQMGFPFLDNRLVDFSQRLAPELKVKGQQLRWFFKDALRDFLPMEIIKKKKQGFGLPFGVWLTQHGRLRDLAMASLESLRQTGVIRAEFLDRLLKEYLPQHPGYYGEMVWILMMMAQWNDSRGSVQSQNVTKTDALNSLRFR
ncbi:asparagine synthetase 1 [mine drainage metagenome]|uniref:Asparagine synthetase 1 n=1 Tax=mine drainage metagenome TaxID=410659 RepID=A0A1J5SFF1_9ZZZZ